jgi:dTDP-4-dehydrorhamnose reductase
MTGDAGDARPLEAWAGVECSYVRTPAGLVDQLAVTGHEARDADIDRLAELGVSRVRYPVLWGRGRGGEAAPETDWPWAVARLERLRSLGIDPVVGLLHHGQGPLPGGLLDPAFPAAFAAYARAAAERVPWVTDWLPINEPLTTARFAGMYGLWAPYERRWDAGVRMLLAQCLAIRAAIRAVRDVVPNARLLVNEDVGRTRGTRECRDAVVFCNRRRWLTFDLLTGRVGARHPLRPMLAVDGDAIRVLDDLAADPEPPDWIGVDHYVTSDRWIDDRLERFPAQARGGDGRVAYADVELVRVDRRGYRPFAAAIRDAWARYRRPIVLAEVQLAGDPWDQAAWWLGAWRAATDARSAGIDVRAVTAWSAFGAWDWSTLLSAPGGYEPGAFDVRDGEPRRTALGHAIAATARGSAHGPSPDRLGWWTRPDRVAWRTRTWPRGRGAAPPDGGRAAAQPGDEAPAQASASVPSLNATEAAASAASPSSAAVAARPARIAAHRSSSAKRSAETVPGSAAYVPSARPGSAGSSIASKVSVRSPTSG